jgi:large subunit ribosomal protein L4
MATVTVFDQSKKEVGSLELSPEIFEVEVRPEIMHLVVRAQLAAKRVGTRSPRPAPRLRRRQEALKQGTGHARRVPAVAHLARRCVIFAPPRAASSR